MYSYKWIMIGCLVAVATACSPSSDDSKDVNAKKTEHVWQDQVDTLDKARAVEKTLMDAHQQRDEALRQQN